MFAFFLWTSSDLLQCFFFIFLQLLCYELLQNFSKSLVHRLKYLSQEKNFRNTPPPALPSTWIISHNKKAKKINWIWNETQKKKRWEISRIIMNWVRFRRKVIVVGFMNWASETHRTALKNEVKKTSNNSFFKRSFIWIFSRWKLLALYFKMLFRLHKYPTHT